MANIRTLKLNLLADTTDFAAGIKKASGQTESFSSNMKNALKSVAKNAALAAAAVGGMAVAFGVDAVKAAIEDQKSQKIFANQLKNTTKATNSQIKATEKWITKQQFAYGFSDSKLRPALAKLAGVTHNITEAQDLLSLSMDVAAGTGKDLTTVTDAMAKAQNGNLGALKKLGVPLSDAIIKNKDLTAATKIMSDQFAGAAATSADTFAGKMKIFNERVGEAKETIGTKLLTVLQPLADKWLPRISTLVTDVADGFSGSNRKGAGVNLGKSIKTVADALGDLFAAFNQQPDSGKQRSFNDNIQGLANVLNNLATAINAVAGAFGKINAFSNSPLFTTVLSKIPLFYQFQASKWIKQKIFSPDNSPKKALGGPVQSNHSYMVGEYGPELFIPSGSGSITPAHRVGNGGNTFVFNGIVDGESARRSIERVLQQSSIRSGAINLQGSAL